MVQYINNSGFQQFSVAKDAKKKGRAGSPFVWAAIAVLAGWLTYSWFMPKNEPVKSGGADISTAQQSEDITNVPAERLIGNTISARVAGLRISDIELKNYLEDDGTNVRLLGAQNEFLEVGFSATGTSVPLPSTLWKMNRAAPGEEITMFWKSPEGVEFRRSLTMTQDYVLSVRDTVINNSKSQISMSQYSRIVRSAGDTSAMIGIETGGIAFTSSGMERDSWKALSKKPQMYQTSGGFVGFTDRYWQTVVRADGTGVADETMRIRGRSDGMFQADIAPESTIIAPGAEMTWTAVVFAGPKNQADLAAAVAMIPGIDQTIDYGWFWFLTRPFLWSINALHGLVGNYGIAIILFTILLRILMWPLTKKSFTGMAAMQKMQPEMQRIQKMYANDKMRMQQEMMAMYKRQGSSPVSGCLPMILQIPIFFALYKTLLISVPMRQADFLWITDLSAMDPFFILPILMGATMWYQQRLQTGGMQNAAADGPAANMQKMMKWMPLIFTAMFAWMPAGLVLYWTVSNLFGIGQLWWIKKKS
ncbi:MAG: membrane protein insertase YidC [Alphaproteobacteria bacterium]|nr:membrane protein insertase YidC [Alphaproteobacteria bacterium]MCL2889846.1 membrane protein insertase YidC [Alphaproteobacteria bacterium]